MTDNYIRRAANALPNKHEDATALTVEQIMRERGVGRRQAYFRLRQMRGEQDTQVPVPANQRDRVLVTLYRANGSITDSRVLTQALHEGGYNIDGHDTTKTLWSLQKTNHVKLCSAPAWPCCSRRPRRLPRSLPMTIANTSTLRPR